MAKALEIAGLGLVALMTLGFVGVLEPYGIRNGTSELFWGCAAATLLIIVYRKIKTRREDREDKID